MIISFLEVYLFFFNDIFINFLFQSNGYPLLTLIGLFYFMYLLVNFQYYKKFRLCVKFDRKHKYIYDNSFLFYSDYSLYLIKIFISFQLNSNDKNLCFFFDIIPSIIIIISI